MCCPTLLPRPLGCRMTTLSYSRKLFPNEGLPDESEYSLVLHHTPSTTTASGVTHKIATLYEGVIFFYVSRTANPWS